MSKGLISLNDKGNYWTYDVLFPDSNHPERIIWMASFRDKEDAEGFLNDLNGQE